MPYAEEARFNSYKRQNDPLCLPETRVEILRDIHNWANGEDKRRVFWLSGLAGTGKSTIARTVARDFHDRGRLAASFFFVKGGGDVGHAGRFITTIAVQLASSVPTLYQHIRDARSDIATCSLRDQWQQLIVQPLSKLGSGSELSYMLVVDALDECDGNIPTVLQLLTELQTFQGIKLRILLTSRPEIPIRYGFSMVPDGEYQNFALHNIWPSTVNEDISTFLAHSLRSIGHERSLGFNWPGEECIEKLVQIAGGLFIWAATACKFIRDGRRFAARRLDTIIKSSSAITAPEKHLNEIYTTVLGHCISVELLDEEKDELCLTIRTILGSIVILFSPLSVRSLSTILRISEGDFNQTVEDLHSVLVVPDDDQNQPLRLHHPSFRDFLLDSTRCTDTNFWVDEKQAHQTLANCCLQLMSASLMQGICQITAPGTLVAHVERGQIEQHIPPELQYACLYWIQHIHRGGILVRDDDQVHQFLKEHLLHWLEVLGWIGKVSEGIHAVILLESIATVSQCANSRSSASPQQCRKLTQLQPNSCPLLSEYVYDIKRFIMCSRVGIEQAPLQAYYGALFFAPALSITRKQFRKYIPIWIQRKPEVQDTWSDWYLTLEGHSSTITHVTFSPDGKQLASVSTDNTIKLWDISTGVAVQTLDNLPEDAISVAFSPDEKTLVSAFLGRSPVLRSWDIMTGKVRYSLRGPPSKATAAAFSQDVSLIAWAFDNKIQICDVATGGARNTLKVTQNIKTFTDFVAFSPDGEMLASASYDGMLRVWKVENEAEQHVLYTCSHSSGVLAIAFASDGTHIASACKDGLIKLSNVLLGAVQWSITAHSDWIRELVFAPDGKRLASASDDQTIRIWNTKTGELQHILAGHSGYVFGVAFSPDGQHLASASRDRSVKLWRLVGEAQPLRDDDLSAVSTLAMSQDGTQLATGFVDGTIMLWDIAEAAVRHTLKGHSSSCDSIAFSPDGSCLASALYYDNIILWDTRTGQIMCSRNRYLYVGLIAFSPNSKRIATGSLRGVQLWDLTRDNILRRELTTPINGPIKISGTLNAITLSPGGKLVIVAFAKYILVWDFASGEILQTYTAHESDIRALAVSPNSKLLASTSSDKTVKLWDLKSSASIQTLVGHQHLVNLVAFSPDSKLIVSASEDKTVILWDAELGTSLRTFHLGIYLASISFCDEGKSLHTNRGYIYDILSTTDGSFGEGSARSVFFKEQWISIGSENIIWLPFDQRTDLIVAHRNAAALGHGPGRVTVLKVDLDMLKKAIESWC